MKLFKRSLKHSKLTLKCIKTMRTFIHGFSFFHFFRSGGTLTTNTGSSLSASREHWIAQAEQRRTEDLNLLIDSFLD